MSFSTYDVQRRTSKNSFYSNINKIINWKPISNIINQYYSAGISATGKPGYDGLILFKMLLVGIWYDLSDRDCEEMVNENLSAMSFCGLQLENTVPDHTVLSRFRTLLTNNKALEPLFKEINRQLESHGILVKTGCKIDATITESERKPKRKTTFQIAEDRKEDEISNEDIEKQTSEIQLIKVTERGVDTQARFLKKGSKTHYGFKMHAATDENGLVLGITTTAANVHDSQEFEKLIEKAELPKRAKVYADKAYRSLKNSQILKDKGLKNRIHYKAVKNKPLNARQKHFNKVVSQFRYTVERTFGSVKKWFGGDVARYVGLAKTETQHYLQSICYNIKRAPRLIIEKAIREHQLKTIKV